MLAKCSAGTFWAEFGLCRACCGDKSGGWRGQIFIFGVGRGGWSGWARITIIPTTLGAVVSGNAVRRHGGVEGVVVHMRRDVEALKDAMGSLEAAMQQCAQGREPSIL